MIANISVRSKIALVGVCLLLILLITVAIAATTFAVLTQRTQEMSSAHRLSAAVGNAYEQWTMDDDQSNMYAAVIALRDPKQRQLAESTYKQVEDAHAKAQHYLNDAAVLATDDKTRALIAAVRGDMASYDRYTRLMRERAVAGDVLRAVHIMTVENLEPSNSIPIKFDKLGALSDGIVAHAESQIHQQAALGRTLLIVVAIVGLSGMIVVLVLLANALTQRLSPLTLASQRLAAGDLDVLAALPTSTKDELGVLASSFRAMVDHQQRMADVAEAIALGDLSATPVPYGRTDRLGHAFKKMVENMRELVVHVSATSEHLSATSEIVARASSESSAAVDHISKSIETLLYTSKEQSSRLFETGTGTNEVASAVSQIAHGASDQANAVQAAATSVQGLNAEIGALASVGEKLANAARSAGSQAGDGTDATERTAAAMQQLRQTSAAAVTSMTALNEQSEQVGEIVSTIEQIADQTNLLALNAAIEAARAGDHGRGFAVVASEIRKLAERSTSATREISDILTSIRRQAVDADSAMRSSATAVQTGLELSERVSDAFFLVSKAISEMTQIATEVARRSEAMRSESDGLSSNVGAVSAVVEENATAARQLDDTARSISQGVAALAAMADQQSEATDQVSTSAVEFAAQVKALDASAATLRDQSAGLSAYVATFIVSAGDEPSLSSSAPRRALQPA